MARNIARGCTGGWGAAKKEIWLTQIFLCQYFCDSIFPSLYFVWFMWYYKEKQNHTQKTNLCLWDSSKNNNPTTFPPLQHGFLIQLYLRVKTAVLICSKCNFWPFLFLSFFSAFVFQCTYINQHKKYTHQI